MSLTNCKNSLVYDELNKLIFEYLEINGLENTLDAFTSECASKCLPCPSPSDPECKAAFSHYEGVKLLKAFDDGNLTDFFKLWRIFQSHIQVTSDDMAKLEVYIRVHFALWPRAHNQPEEVQEKAMGELKLFFEQQKSSLGKDSTILPLYALPFVEDPFSHPIFKELFRDLWTMKLRNQLEVTVQKYFELLQENICSHSRLAELVVKGERYEEGGFGCSNKAGFHQDRFYQLLGNHRKIRKLLQGTRESYAKLLLVTHELVVALEQSVSGQPIPMDSILDKCFYIFPEIFTPKTLNSASDVEGKPNIEYFKQLSASANFDPTQDSEVSLFFLGISNVSPEFLDYEKMKETLTDVSTASVSDKLCLLQALRWLITRTTESCRATAVESFVGSDIFGISLTTPEYREKLFHCMLYPTPTYQKECLARFVNAISSTRTGRNYLSSTVFIADTMIKSLTTFTGITESFICQMVVATLQKLSLKRSMRIFMIQHKVIDWLVMFIKKELDEQTTAVLAKTSEKDKSKNHNDLSTIGSFNPYLMEYAWALLMNLCLHEEAWTSCIENGADLIKCACTMLKVTPRKDLAPYVVSTLYSVLRCPEMYDLAKKLQLETLVSPLLTENSELAEHLNNLISLLYMKGCDRITSSRETNYDDEDSPDPDIFEPEIELSESWTTALVEESDLTGDDLLLRKYLIEKADPVVPETDNASAENELRTNTGEIIIRPITPTTMGTTSIGTTTTGKPKKKTPQQQLHFQTLTNDPNSTLSSTSVQKKTGVKEAGIKGYSSNNPTTAPKPKGTTSSSSDLNYFGSPSRSDLKTPPRKSSILKKSTTSLTGKTRTSTERETDEVVLDSVYQRPGQEPKKGSTSVTGESGGKPGGTTKHGRVSF
ncbi:lisH domain-containing protein ARMC9 [Folsomia candida]|uniref:lisH domain-containing protein ARMC9 n=1 Tax=Folsomia candida TaxID=158441 RepID=UPI001604BA0C|nr:lisH domain-containing protein ARMC9 [Folsomia candida]